MQISQSPHFLKIMKYLKQKYDILFIVKELGRIQSVANLTLIIIQAQLNAECVMYFESTT